MDKIWIDSRLKKNVESLNIYEEGVCSAKFKDIEDTFWFDTVAELSNFLRKQERERYYDKTLRKGLFEYINEYGEKIVYKINKVIKGRVEIEE